LEGCQTITSPEGLRPLGSSVWSDEETSTRQYCSMGGRSFRSPSLFGLTTSL